MAHAEQQSTYSEKLRDPRWQKLRLQVMERDEWACQICFDSESTLAVHHRYYVHGKEPWEYPLDALVTLCEHCHEKETQDRREAERRLLFALRKAGFYASGVQAFADAFARVDALNSVGADILSSALAWVISEPIQLYILEKRFHDEVARRKYGEESDEYKHRHEYCLAQVQELEATYRAQEVTRTWPVPSNEEND